MNFTEDMVKFNEKYWSVTFDDKYIYVHQDGRGIKKLVKTEGGATKVGYTIQENTQLYRGQKCKILFLNGRIYLRTSDSENHRPFKLINPDTLNEIEGEELETLTKKFDDIKRKETDERNAHVFEWGIENHEEKKDQPGRYLITSPLFSEGRYIYVVAQWKKVQSEDGDISSEDEGEQSLKINKLKVEVYDPETLQFVKEVQLNFGKKNNDWNYDPKEFFNRCVRNWEHLSWSTNGKEIIIQYDYTAFFNAESGELIYYNSDSSCETFHYDYTLNQFWNITQDDVVASFKKGVISNFSSSEKQQTSSKISSLADFRKTRFNLALKAQENLEKIQPRTSKTIFKELIKKPEPLKSKFKISGEGNIDATIFLVLSIISKGCTELTKQAKKVASSSGEINDKVSLYKTQFGTQLTSTFYLELI